MLIYMGVMAECIWRSAKKIFGVSKGGSNTIKEAWW